MFVTQQVPLELILGLSVASQIAAAIIAFRLIHITGRRLAWGLIAMALALMAVRRIIPLYHLISGDASISVDPLFEFIGFILSLSMAFGLALVSPFVERRQAQEALRSLNKELEQRVADQTAEIRRTYEAVKSERKRLHDVLETLPALVALVTPDYHVSFANRVIRERFGESRGRHCYDYIFGRSQPCEFCQTDKVLRSKTPHHGECLAKDGRSLDIYNYPFTDADGASLVLVMGIDITERKQAEEALQKANAYNRSLIEASLDPLVMIGPDGKITDVNEATELVTGVVRERLIGSDFSDYFTEPENARRVYQRVLSEELVKDYPLTMRHTSGRTIDVLYNATTYKDPDGKVKGVFAAARDITEREEVEEALRESEEKYRLLVANAGEAIFIYQDKVVKFPNPKTLEMTGYSAEELVRLPFSDLVHPEDRRVFFERYVERLSREASPKTYPFRIINKNSKVIWVEIISANIVWEKRPGVLCFLRDVTIEKNLEAQFIQAQKMEGIGRLASGAAHDFNNILSIISGCADIALRQLKENDPLWAELQEILKAGERAAVLTRRLLAFSRKQVLAPEVFNLNALIGSMEGMLKRLIGEDVELVAAPANDLWWIKADPSQVEQVIMNLAVNARDAMPKGGKLTIETSNVQLDEQYVSTHLGSTPGPHVMLVVSDNGCGMDRETMSNLFEPFFTTKEQGKGTGLGLSTVYGIVKQSGGSIWVHSELGKGSAFKLYFPRVEEVPKEKKPRQPSISERGVGETVLVVEDEEPVRRLVARILELSNYKVVAARDGNEAISLCEQYAGRIDLLVTDVVMPKMNGYQLAERLTQLRPEMKVLYMSGYTDRTIVSKDMLEPGINFMQKPIILDKLLAKVRDILVHK